MAAGLKISKIWETKKTTKKHADNYFVTVIKK
jgi:hypothetical protein